MALGSRSDLRDPECPDQLSLLDRVDRVADQPVDVGRSRARHRPAQPRSLRLPAGSRSARPPWRTPSADPDDRCRSRQSCFHRPLRLALGLNTGTAPSSARRHEVDRHRHADPHISRLDVDQVRQHPHTLVEIDQRSDDRIVEAGILRMVKDRVAVDHPGPGQVHHFVLERVAVRAHRPRRVAQPPHRRHRWATSRPSLAASQ